jgi:hypothetical protein
MWADWQILLCRPVGKYFQGMGDPRCYDWVFDKGVGADDVDGLCAFLLG